jgi:hypothetical protein
LEHEQRMTDENQQQQPRRSFLFDTSISMRRYVLRMGLISLLPSIAIGMVLAATGVVNEKTGPSFEGGPWLLVLASVWFIGPALETLLMSLILWVLSFFTRRMVLLAVMSALIWAVLHSLAAPVWGLVIFWPFFIFSCSYLAWRQKAWWRAVWVTCCVHMFQNFIPGIVIAATL